LFLGNLQPLPPPDALHALGVHTPAFRAKQRRDPAITVTTIFAGKPDDVCRQGIFIWFERWSLALGRTVLADNETSSALRYFQLRLYMVDAAPATGGA